ncbi:MAG: DUF1080 domain-containing protein [Bacteroidia bacterium]|nr:DUF1080 domain-containing protein [Bacteroidia bacterium]
MNHSPRALLLVLLVTGLAACSTPKTPPATADVSTPAAADNTLTAAEQAEGWTLLFDGKSPAGWRGFNQVAFPAGWVIEGGALKALGTAADATGGDIVYAADSFANFEMVLDWKISPGGNSGIFYHVKEGEKYPAAYYTGPEYQVIDDAGYPGPLEEDQKAGADYDMYPPDPGKVLKPAGEWNQSRIVFTPEKAEYYLNGKMTASFVPWSEDWNAHRTAAKWKDFPDYGQARTGLIGLQDHGQPVWYKNIKIRKR